ncbi:MAG: ATP-binding cassette domain-containing protein [Myxococcales bacterium]|nr:ATP-binding cassette domain-containing protein [Myxococcales bacterium]
MTAPAMRVRASRRFGDCVALADAALEVAAGTVHALCGENGAGKSTLMRVVYGLERADRGELELGERIDLARHGVAQAQARGVGMVHQHGMLVPTLTLADNAALGHEPVRGGRYDRAAAARALVAAAARLGQRLDPDALAGDLTVGEQQRAELAMVAARATRLLILDEPTALLAPREVDALFAMVRAFADGGGAVVLVTHKLDEVMAVADEVTVLRAGRTVASWSAEVTAAEIARAMIGGEPPPPATRAPTPAADAAIALAIEGVAAPGPRGGGAVDVTLRVAAGEVVGVAGVEGNGQRELALAVAGLAPVARGAVAVGGVDVTRATVAARRALGLAHVPEDRHLHGLVQGASVADNVALGRLAEVGRGPLIDRAAVATLTTQLLAAHDVRPADPAARAGALSGGNQQKLVVARELDRPGLRAVLAVHPTRGVDLAASARIHARLRDVAAAGAAVLLIAADLDELLALCHRVVVMHRGALAGELAGAALAAPDARARLGAWMVGATP